MEGEIDCVLPIPKGGEIVICGEANEMSSDKVQARFAEPN